MNTREEVILATLIASPETLTREELEEAKAIFSRRQDELRELSERLPTSFFEGVAAPPDELVDRLRAIALPPERIAMARPPLPPPTLGVAPAPAGPPRRPRKVRWVRFAAAAAAVLLILIPAWYFFPSGHQTVVIVSADPTKVQKWEPTSFMEAERGAEAIGQEETVYRQRPVTGPRSKAGKNPMELERAIYELGEIENKITITGRDGQVRTFDVPAEESTKVSEDPDVVGAELTAEGFDVRTYHRAYHARLCKQILFTAQDVNVFPGAILQGEPWVKRREIVPLAAEGGWLAPVRLTLYGVSRDSPLPKASDLVLATRDLQAATMPEVKGPDAHVLAESQVLQSIDRESYEQALRDLVPRVHPVDLWSASVEAITSRKHLSFLLNASANGGFGPFSGSAAGSIDEQEDEDRARVFMLLNQASYTVAVAGNEPPAARFTDQADPTRIRFQGPPVYVSSVTYGQLILVMAESALKSSEVKKALRASFSYAGYGNGKVEMDRASKETLESTSISVFVYGGQGKSLFDEKNKMVLPSRPTTETAQGFDGITGLLSRLLTAKLEPSTALPIAFDTKYLSNHKPAGFTGVLPLKTYQSRPEPYRYEVSLVRAQVKDSYDGFFRGGCGEIYLMTSHGDDDHAMGLPEQDYCEGTYDYDPPAKFTGPDKAEHAPGRRFTLRLRVGEEDSGRPNNWGDMARLDDWAESSATISVDELLAAPNYEKDYTFSGFKGGNTYTLRVRLTPPDSGLIKDKDITMKAAK